MSTQRLLLILLIGLIIGDYSAAAQSAIQPATVVEALAWSPDGSMIAAGYTSGRIDLLDTQSGALLRSIRNFSIVNSLDWNLSDPSLLAAGGSLNNNPGVIAIIDVNTGNMQLTLDAAYEVSSVRWSPDGRLLAASSNTLGFNATTEREEVLIWNVETGTLVARAPLGVSNQNITAIDWSPDGSQIVGGTSNYTLVIWDARSGERVNVVPETGVVVSLDWARETTNLAVSVTGVEDRNTHVWNTDSWIRTLSISANGAIVQWQPGSAHLALGEMEQLRVIDVETSQPLLAIPVSGAVRALAYSPYGGRLALGGLPMPNSDSVLSHSLLANPDMPMREIANDTIWIVVPDPSPTGLESVATACGAPVALASSLTASAEAGQFETAVAQVNALFDSSLPPGCAADMRAVIEAMAVQ